MFATQTARLNDLQTKWYLYPSFTIANYFQKTVILIVKSYYTVN